MKLLAKPITEFTYEELAELEGYIRSHEFISHKGKLWPDYSRKINDKFQKNRESRARIIEREASEFPALKAFVKTWIKQGSLIRLRGTKNRGWREVVRVEGNDIFGMCIYGKGRNTPPATNFAYTGSSSSNQISNLIGFRNPEDGIWYNRKQIVEIGKKLL
jgi:hypothetical protein